MKKLLFGLAVLSLFAVPHLRAQSQAQAKRLGDLQIGGGYTYGSSDYVPEKLRGFMFYSDFDFREHFGIEVAFHQINDPSDASSDSHNVYQRTYEVGGRYFRRYYGGHVKPYVKAMYGRGVFNYPSQCVDENTGQPTSCTSPTVLPASTEAPANLAYNMLVLGGGADFVVHPRINVRADYEYQRWLSFPPNGLSPMIVSIGVAYHFPAGKPR